MVNNICIEIGNNKDNKKLPHWKKTIIIDENNEYYLAASLFGDEHWLTLMASYDSVLIATYKNHIFLPVSWLKNELNEDDYFDRFLQAVKKKNISYKQINIELLNKGE